MSAAFGAYALLTALMGFGLFTGTDLLVRNMVADFTPPLLISTSAFMARLGQGGPLMALALMLAVVQSYRVKSAKPVALWVIAAAALMGLVGISKVVTRRGAPADIQIDAVQFFSKGFCGEAACQSYPSGHAANAVVWYGLALIILHGMVGAGVGRVLLLVVASLTAVTNVISGHHWLTDSLAGIFVGTGIYLLLKTADKSAFPFLRLIDSSVFASSPADHRQAREP
jgi:membrane-associated phospholipid phosphatase